MEELLTREEALEQKLEEIRVKQDVRLLQYQPVRLDYDTHEGSVAMELDSMFGNKANVLLLDMVFNYGRMQGIREERARRRGQYER